MTTTLSIITTKEKYLPTGGLKNGLFSKNKGCTLVKSNEVAQLFSKIKENSKKELSEEHQAQIWQMHGEDQTVFCVRCLPNDTTLTKPEKDDFIKAVFKDALSALPLSIKESIQQVFFFGHSIDLAYGKAKIAPLNEANHSLLKHTSWLEEAGFFENKKIVVGKGGEQGSEKTIALYFTAFSHENQAFLGLLENSERLLGKGTIAQEMELQAKWLRGWALEKIWRETHIGQNDKKFNLKQKLPYHFNLYYTDSEGLRQKFPGDFLYKDLVDSLTVENMTYGAEMKVNVVIFPLVAIAEFADLSFYENVIETLHPKEVDHEPLPTLFINFWDIMKEADKEKSAYAPPFDLDRRYKFLDSSIWYRYVPINGDFEENLTSALETIEWAYRNRLYKKNVCREFLEFQNRMVRNSYLDSTFGSGHAMRVFPFTFHAESAMAIEALKSAAVLNSSKLDWNILLVDDYAAHPLKEGELETVGKSKGEIIFQLMASWPVNPDALTKAVSHINHFETCSSVDIAVDILGCGLKKDEQNKAIKTPYIIYDLILLDYLFSHKDAKRNHYGTELLDTIQNTESRTGLGVLQNYWIYPISVFNEAIQSHLQEKGYQYMEQYWQLARGADPLNTPHLFRRTLFKFLESQVQKIRFQQEEIWMFLADHAEGLLKNAERSTDNTVAEIHIAFGISKQTLDRAKAQQAFRKFIERYSMDEGLPANSALSYTIRKELEATETKDLRDHLRQLLYLLGFSVGFDFTSIKEELDCIEALHVNIGEAKLNKTEIERVRVGMQSLSRAVYSISGKYF